MGLVETGRRVVADQYWVKRQNGSYYLIGSGDGATAYIRAADGTWVSDAGSGYEASVKLVAGGQGTARAFGEGPNLAQIYATDWTEVYNSAFLRVQAFGLPAVEAVADDSDSTYVQIRQAASLYAWAKWKLPALPSANDGGITGASVFARLYYDPTPIFGAPYTLAPPKGFVRLTYPSDGTATLQTSYPTLTASTYTDWNPTIDVTSTAARQTNFAGFLDALASGDGELWTVMEFQFEKETRLNIVELYLSLT